MNIKDNLRKLAELGIVLTAIATLVLAGCGGGGNSSFSPAIPLTGLVTTFAGASSAGYTDAAGTNARFNVPAFIASDGTYLYVTDAGNNAIRKIALTTGGVTTLAGSLTGASGVTDGIGTSALFNDPRGIVSDGTNLYIADAGNNNIRKIVIATGMVTTLAGSTAGASGVADAIGTTALFNFPIGITKLGTNLYVSDSSNYTIRKIDLTTNAVTTLAGLAGTPGYTTGLSGSSARFTVPTGLTTDGTDLFVADAYNYDIRKVNVTTALVSIVAGGYFVNGYGSTDGTGTSARFNIPFGITTNGTNLYVADTYNHTVRNIVIASQVVTTLAGTAGASGVTDGTATSARFYKPSGIIYVNGALYVADSGNNSIRKIQ